MDFPGRLIAGFLVIMLLLIFPLQYIAGLNNESIDALVDDRTHHFTDSVRGKGYLDKQMYEEYINYLDTTGERYDVELQDIRPVKGEYISSAESTTRKEIKALHTNSYTDITASAMSIDKIQSFASHIHTDDCYAGNLHVCNGVDCEYDGESILLAKKDEKLYYTKNGTKWTQINIPGLSNYEIKNNCKIKYENGQFIMILSKNIYTSDNGINWAEGQEFNYLNLSYNYFGGRLHDVVYGDNGYYYATGELSYPGYPSYDVLYRSPDLTNWTYIKSLDNCEKLAVSRIGEQRYLVVNIDANREGKEYHSIERLNKNGSVTRIGGTNMDYSLHQAGDYLVFFKRSSFFHSTQAYAKMLNENGKIVDIPLPEETHLTHITYGQGVYLAVNGRRVFSGNELTNMQEILENDLNIDVVTRLAHFNGKFYLSGFDTYSSGSSGYSVYSTYTSPDGITWTKTPYYSSFVTNEENLECSKIGRYYDNTGKEVTPICHRVVTSITATNPTQTVDKGNPIITTAIATYLDGHTDIVNCTSNYNPNVVGNQTVTLTYSGLVENAKTTGTKTCTINVTVRPINVLSSITVLPTSQTIQRYSSPSFTVRANYNDGTNRLLNASQYSISGFNASRIGLQSVTISYTENGIKKTAKANVMVTVLLKECPRCHQLYELNIDDSDSGCPHCRELVVGIEVTPNYVELTQGDILPITVNAIYNDGSSEEVVGWTSNYNPTRIGLQIVTVQYRGYAADISVWVNERLINCPTCDTDYPASEENCPVCAEKVIRIVASPKDITVMQYESISLNVTAYYADGSSREVDEWAIDRTSVTAGIFEATVSYKGVSDTITLRVISINSTECPICGTIYDLSDSPKGCPICSEEIIGIEAYLTSGSNMVQLGIKPAIAVILIFRDEHREFANEGYKLENYKAHELGVQTLRVLYKGFATTIIIEVVNILDTITCPNGHVYNRNEDGTDPGCPFCHEGYDVSNISYFDITYTSEILGRIYSVGIYHFQKSNYLSVIVTKKDKSLMYQLQNTFFSTSMLGRKKRFIYGGEVN